MPKILDDSLVYSLRRMAIRGIPKNHGDWPKDTFFCRNPPYHLDQGLGWDHIIPGWRAYIRDLKALEVSFYNFFMPWSDCMVYGEVIPGTFIERHVITARKKWTVVLLKIQILRYTKIHGVLTNGAVDDLKNDMLLFEMASGDDDLDFFDQYFVIVSKNES